MEQINEYVSKICGEVNCIHIKGNEFRIYAGMDGGEVGGEMRQLN